MTKNNKKIIFAIVIIAAVAFFIFAFINFYEDFIPVSEPEITEENDLDEEIFEEEELLDYYGFGEMIMKAENPRTLVRILNNQFTFEARGGSTVSSPEEFFQKGVGGEQDFASFTAHLLHYNDFNPSIFAYRYLKDEDVEGIGFVVLFRPSGQDPQYIYFNEQGAHLDNPGWSFVDLYRKERERLGIDIIEYGIVVPTAISLIPEDWREAI